MGDSEGKSRITSIILTNISLSTKRVQQIWCVNTYSIVQKMSPISPINYDVHIVFMAMYIIESLDSISRDGPDLPYV